MDWMTFVATAAQAGGDAMKGGAGDPFVDAKNDIRLDHSGWNVNTGGGRMATGNAAGGELWLIGGLAALAILVLWKKR